MTLSPPVRPGLLLLAGLLTALPLRAADGGFTATLEADQRNVAGLATLTPDEDTALDRLVAADLAFARSENLAELSGAFVARRTAAERKLAGLDKLTPTQRADLNELVANAIAARPHPKERPRLRDSEVFNAKRLPEVHGAVSFTYGWGVGRTYRASSLRLDYYDPENHFGLGVGIMTSDGGYGGYYPGYGYPGFYASSYDPFSPGFFDASYRDDSAAGSSLGEGIYSRRPASGDFPGCDFRRHW